MIVLDEKVATIQGVVAIEDGETSSEQ